jgi:hypothetical protein
MLHIYSHAETLVITEHKAPIQAPSIVKEKTFSWTSVCISCIMEFAMKVMFCLAPMCQRHGERL